MGLMLLFLIFIAQFIPKLLKILNYTLFYIYWLTSFIVLKAIYPEYLIAWRNQILKSNFLYYSNLESIF